MINFIRRLWARKSSRMSQVTLYAADNSTRSFSTSAMDEGSRRKLLKHLFRSYELKFVEIDGKPYFSRGKKIESL
jgi:hypothetical protein